MVDGTVGAVDNTGAGTKKVDVSELQVGANTVERQRIVLSNNANATAFATNFPAGFLRITDEPTQIFYDAFDAVTLDTTARWNAAVSSGGGVGAMVTSGSLTLGTGTTISGYAYITSMPSFMLTVPAWLGVSFAVQLENPVTANTYRFWGTGTPAGSPTAAAPITNGIGFEMYTDGKLYAVVYNAGSRTVIQDMSAATGNSTQPADANYHRYILYIRTDRTFWYVDQLDTVAATSNFQAPATQTQPALFLAVAGSSAPSSSGVLTCTGVAVWDTGKNNHSISDGTYGFRKAQVGSSGGLSIKGASITGTSASIGVASTGTIGPVNVSEAGSVTFTIKNTTAGSAFTGNPVLVFEQSDDNVSYGPLSCVRNDSYLSGATFTLAANSANTELMFDAPVEGASYVRCRVTTGPSSNAMTVVIVADGSAFSPLISLGGVGVREDSWLNTRTDPTTLLQDTFETLNTTVTWTTGGTAPTATSGTLSCAAGTTANATSYLTSQPKFINGSAAYLNFVSAIQFEAGAITGNQRYWGLGTITTPTLTVPVQNGVVFELDNVAGSLLASVYSNGARTQTVSLTRPTDASGHRYSILYRASKVYYQIDGIPVANFNYPNPTVDQLGIVIGSVNGGATLGTAAVLQGSVLTVGDTGRNNQQISDGLFPWQKVSVKATNTAPQTVDSALVVGLHPTSTLPTGTNTIGAIKLLGNTGATVDAAILSGAAPTNVLWSTAAPSTIASAACNATVATSVTNGVIKASAGTLYGFAFNNAAVLQYLQIYNLTTGSTGSASIVLTFPIASSGMLVIPPGSLGLINNATGISWGVTTTAVGGTAGTAALLMTAFYK